MVNYRATHPQRRIIDVEMLGNKTSVNNLPIFILFPNGEEELLKKALLKVLTQVKDLHLLLTTTQEGEFELYDVSDDVIAQKEEIQIIDLKDESKAIQDDYVDRFLLKPFEDILNHWLYEFRIILTTEHTILCLRIHHLICDGTGIANLRDYIVRTFESLKSGNDYLIPNNSYWGYQKIEENYLKSPKCKEDRDYWLSHLADLSGCPEEITNSALFHSKATAIELSKETILSLSSYTNSFTKPISPFVFALGLFQIFIGRYYQAEKVLVTTGFHNRRYEEAVNNSVGMLVSTVPLCMKYDGSSTITKVLEQAKAELKSGLSHSSYPYDLLLGDLTNAGIDTKKLLNFAIVSNSYNESEKYPIHITKMNASYAPLLLRVNLGKDDKQGLQALHLEFRRDCFSEQEMQTITSCFQAMLEDIAANPNQTCGQVRLLSEKEEFRILNEFNHGQILGQDRIQNQVQVQDHTQTILHMFQKQVLEVPDKIAVVYEDRHYSYRQLDEITDYLAKHLIRLGVKEEDTVAVLIDRSEYMVIYPLAILKAGACYMPLDYTFPTDRLEYMLRDAQVKFVLSEGDKPETYIPGFIDTVLKREDLVDLKDQPEIKLSMPKGEHKFVVLYTSGSTGLPKGCVLEHRNLANFIKFHVSYSKITDLDRGAAYANFAFDAHMIDTYPMLISGGTVYIISSTLRFDFIALNDYFEKNKITITFMTTLLGKQFVETFDNRSLRALIIGGEKLPSIKLPKYDLIHGYGPTECTVYATNRTFMSEDECLNIGRPIDNCQCYILDQNMQLLPIGMVGELCIGGAGVARGYLNRPELNQEKFIMWRGHRVYRTGDHVKWLDNGEIEFVGRMDGQVKLRGLRIELGEIESKILQFKGITACAVAVKDIGQTQHLCAYYVSTDDIDIDNLKKVLTVDLTSFMIPEVFVRMKQLPFTSNGKVNKKALPEPVMQQKEIVKPRNEKEQAIFEVISELVSSKDFGVTSDLFTIGLTSLMAIKLAVFIKNKLALTVATSDIIKGRTIETIAKLSKEINESFTEAGKFAKMDYYPLTQNQMGVYFDCAKQPGTLKYNMPMAYYLSSKIDAQKLANALKGVIEAHPYLKTNLAMHGQILKQVLRDERKVFIPVYKVSDDDLQQAIDTFVKPFDLFSGPLFRAAVYQTPEQVCLLTDFHHIIFDGGSMDLLLQDLERVYTGESIRQEEMTAYELALLEEKQMDSEAYGKAQAYFSQKLKGCEGATEIITDKNEVEAEGELREQIAVIGKDKVCTFCKQIGVTPSNLFLAGLSYVVARFTSSKIVLLATLDNGRREVGHERIMGMLVKTLPIVLTVDSKLSVHDFIQQIQNDLFETLEHDCYPLTRIVQEYHFSPQINYAYQGGVLNEYTIGEQEAKLKSLELKKPKFKLSVHIEEDKQHFRICTQYNDALYSAELMQTFADGVMLAVERMLTDHSKSLGKISILSPQQHLMLRSFNETSNANPECLVHHLFEEQVNKHGEARALIAKDGVYTYARLNEDANCIANALIKRGLKVEDRVAFLLPRDGRLLATMLGVLKAGGAYIPIDPDYPIERIQYILEDASARFLISSSKQSLERNGQALCLMVEDLLNDEDKANPKVDVRPDNLSYIIYTSGSTGKPKGVMLEHKGIANYVAPSSNNYHVRALVESATAMLSVTTVSFDMFLKESFTVLMNGLTLVLASEEEANNPVQLVELFMRTGADAFNATPSRMLQYLELPAFREALGQCKVVMAGGEAYPSILLEKLKQITEARLLNTYGPTEITVSSNAKELKDGVITVGAPLANVLEYIVDTEGNWLPIGVTGELLIGGEGVARGYWGKESLTAKSFINTPEGRVYKTGDLAKWTRDGEVVILGRNDSQVKLRGLRIELEEIQTAICRYQGINSAIVIIHKVKGIVHICAYYTGVDLINPEELREELKKSLPKYMVPTAYMQLTSLPVSPNGKTDIKALPEPVLIAKQDYVAPTNVIEQSFCEIFAQVLNLENPGIEDDFFDLGGTSLLVTKVTIEALNRGYNLSYGDVFTHSTAKELAALLSQDLVQIDEREKQNDRKEREAGQQQGHVEQQSNAKRYNNGDAIDEYDYYAIDKILKLNTLEAFKKGDKQKLGNVLLTGATGFLGIHVLKEYIESEDGVIYCFMRAGRQSSLEKRLKGMLVYYFENSYDDLFGSRIFPVEGDITEASDFEQLKNLPIDTLINCAANVKHFARTEEITRINVEGVQNAIDFCKEKDCQLIQISTASVAGISVNNYPCEELRMDETMLYFGQNLDNKYICSKFCAERLVLQEITQGLRAKIMRVGNLMARSGDGEFQINFQTNGFVNRLRAYQAIGKIAYSTLSAKTELAPIDSTAQAVLKLVRAPKECCVFHPYNNHDICIGDVIEAMREKGMPIEAVEACEFDQALAQAMRDKSKAEALAGLIAYLNLGRGKRVILLSSSNDYTTQALYRCGFKWPLTTDQYLDQFISLLSGLGFFKEDSSDV